MCAPVCVCECGSLRLTLGDLGWVSSLQIHLPPWLTFVFFCVCFVFFFVFLWPGAHLPGYAGSTLRPGISILCLLSTVITSVHCLAFSTDGRGSNSCLHMLAASPFLPDPSLQFKCSHFDSTVPGQCAHTCTCMYPVKTQIDLWQTSISGTTSYCRLIVSSLKFSVTCAMKCVALLSGFSLRKTCFFIHSMAVSSFFYCYSLWLSISLPTNLL